MEIHAVYLEARQKANKSAINNKQATCGFPRAVSFEGLRRKLVRLPTTPRMVLTGDISLVVVESEDVELLSGLEADRLMVAVHESANCKGKSVTVSQERGRKMLLEINDRTIFRNYGVEKTIGIKTKRDTFGMPEICGLVKNTVSTK